MTKIELINLTRNTLVVITKTSKDIEYFRSYKIGQELVYCGKKIKNYNYPNEYSYDFIVEKNQFGIITIGHFTEDIHNYIETKPKYRLMKLKDIF